jgi:deoxyhypusine synthase
MTTETNWSHEYSKQRKDRMQDAIDDYLHDDKVSARQTYEEMLSCIDDVIGYHKTSMERAVKLKELMLGHREIDFLQE